MIGVFYGDSLIGMYSLKRWYFSDQYTRKVKTVSIPGFPGSTHQFAIYIHGEGVQKLIWLHYFLWGKFPEGYVGKLVWADFTKVVTELLVLSY